MLTCYACQRRTFHVLSRHNVPGVLNTPPLFRSIAKAPRPTRQYAIVAANVTADPYVPLIPSSRNNDVPETTGSGRSTLWAARKELDYLADPLHIANRVKLALDKDNFDLGVVITRQASTRANVVVSWNHLIDYQLRKGRIHAALKLFNEMKKRAQQPNAQTFTIIFRGCAGSEHPKLAVSEAVKLYQNMLTIGRIKPNTIHLNAVLQVCAKAGDIDSMFSILTSSDDPLRSPNNQTYTTVLNAMRRKADPPVVRDDPFAIINLDSIEEEKKTVIKQAKAIWDEVISKWRSGSLIIDEELVCAMGRILLMGGYPDADGVESLIAQTMRLSRAKNKALSAIGAAEDTAQMAPRPVTRAPGAPEIDHPLPGNNSLSLILEALEKTGRTTKAAKYWNIFTLNYNVVPDADNWLKALRVFQRGKNSGRTVTALQRMPASMISQKHTRLAMKTCLRDNINRQAFDNANAVLEFIAKNPSISDVKALRIYLQVAHASQRSFNEAIKNNQAAAEDIWAKKLATALEKLDGPYQQLAAKHYVNAPDTNDPKEHEQAQASKAELVALARRMCAVFDIITNQFPTSLTTAQAAKLKLQHANLTRHITAYFETAPQRSSEKTTISEDVDDDDDIVKERKYADNHNSLESWVRANDNHTKQRRFTSDSGDKQWKDSKPNYTKERGNANQGRHRRQTIYAVNRFRGQRENPGDEYIKQRRTYATHSHSNRQEHAEKSDLEEKKHVSVSSAFIAEEQRRVEVKRLANRRKRKNRRKRASEGKPAEILGLMKTEQPDDLFAEDWDAVDDRLSTPKGETKDEIGRSQKDAKSSSKKKKTKNRKAKDEVGHSQKDVKPSSEKNQSKGPKPKAKKQGQKKDTPKSGRDVVMDPFEALFHNRVV